MNPDEMQETPEQAIAKYTTDFTKLAADGKLDPVTRGLEKPQLSKGWHSVSCQVMYRKTY